MKDEPKLQITGKVSKEKMLTRFTAALYLFLITCTVKCVAILIGGNSRSVEPGTQDNFKNISHKNTTFRHTEYTFHTF